MFRVLYLISIISMSLPPVEMKTVKVKKSSLRVVNGELATEGQFFYMVSIKRIFPEVANDIYINVCGGSLIGTSRVLTAAHCFERKGNACEECCKKPQFEMTKQYFAVAGSLHNFQYYGADGQWRFIKSISPHTDYWIPNADILIAHTFRPFDFDEHVKAIQFASKFKDYGNIECKVAGFGRTNYSDEMYSHVLMWANLELISNGKCSRILGENMHDFVCTAKVKTNVLEGDSGSALVCADTGDPNDKGDGVIVGVECCDIDDQNVFTRVSSYSDFVARGESEASHPVFYIVWLSLAVSNVYKSAFKYLII